MDQRPIGVFDSGFGGVNVLAEAVRFLPEENFIFLGDNLHAPYGDRTQQEVLTYTREAVHMLMARHCKAVLIACNTATSAAADALRAELDLPIIGMEPALKPASMLPSDGAVLVMATTMTLKLEKFHLLMQRYGHDAIPVPCPGLVDLIEAGEIDGPRITAKLHELLSPWMDRPIKAVVLGCTHYIYLRPALQAYLPEGVALVDGNAGTVRQLQKRLSKQGLLQATNPSQPPPDARHRQILFLSTSPDTTVPARMQAWFERALAQADATCISCGNTVL